MNAISRPTRRLLRLTPRHIFQSSSPHRCQPLAGPRKPHWRNLHSSHRRLAEEAETERAETQKIDQPEFFKLYKDAIVAPVPTYQHAGIPAALIGKSTVAVGHLKSVSSLSQSLVFGQLTWSNDLPERQVQMICRDPELGRLLKSIKLNTPINVSGVLAHKRPNKKDGDGKASDDEVVGKKSSVWLQPQEIEIDVTSIVPLNAIRPDLHLSSEHVYPPQSRHLSIRFDESLKQRLAIRSAIAKQVRRSLRKFHEIETPILFKSTAEGAREFLVPTRKAGFAYALPQSPQQYKQILMASGINRYFQFAKCFRDEDLRSDRQPEFTQIDLEMAYASGRYVRNQVERVIYNIYNHTPWTDDTLSYRPITKGFPEMTYQDAMKIHGSDKPDLRINAPIYQINDLVPVDLSNMLTSLENPTIEFFKIRLNASPQDVGAFIRRFMDSPEAESFRSNVDGAPGFCIYNSSEPVEGLQTFGFQAAEELKRLCRDRVKRGYETDAAHEVNRTFEDGDLIIMQARESKPFSGSSTAIGRLRLAIYKAALEEKLIEPDLSHRYLWVIDFPMFTLNGGSAPGQGGSAGFSATHHPFTAPKTDKDVDLLLTNPLAAIADHYDLVVNGIELGGGSCRIHTAEMQKFIMRDILKMSEARINDFSHLFSALESGCPPHAGFAIGFDRLVAFFTRQKSIRDVMAFPKSSKGEDLMVKSPSKITDVQLATYHLSLTKNREPAAEDCSSSTAGI